MFFNKKIWLLIEIFVCHSLYPQKTWLDNCSSPTAGTQKRDEQPYSQPVSYDHLKNLLNDPSSSLNLLSEMYLIKQIYQTVYFDNSSDRLKRSVVSNDPLLVALYCKLGDSSNQPYTSWPHNSLLHHAAQGGYYEVTQLLLQFGANAKDKNAIIGNTPLHLAVINNHENVTRLLLENGANVNTINNSYDHTPLYKAVLLNHRRITKISLQYGATTETYTACFKETPLICAASKGHKTIIRYLLDSGADINNNQNGTALIWATLNGQLRAASLLLRRGADPTLRNIRRKTALDIAQESFISDPQFIMRLKKYERIFKKKNSL